MSAVLITGVSGAGKSTIAAVLAPPSSSQAPDPGERALGRGSAKPIACDATAGSDLDAAAGSGAIESPRKTPLSRTPCCAPN